MKASRVGLRTSDTRQTPRQTQTQNRLKSAPHAQIRFGALDAPPGSDPKDRRGVDTLLTKLSWIENYLQNRGRRDDENVE